MSAPFQAEPPDRRPDAIRIAVLVPCHNEALTIGTVVAAFTAALPTARIWVFDNASSDGTVDAARAAGAHVRHVAARGKGHVVRRQFADVEADVYVLVDGDDTYDAAAAQALVAAIVAGNDMAVATRQGDHATAYRAGHVTGNRLLSLALSGLFGHRCRDMLSGYRAFSRRFVKTFPALSSGFEIETELTVHALGLKMPIVEIVADYRPRPQGSHSKLNTWRDGFRICLTILGLLSAERPFLLYGSIGSILATLATALSIPLFVTYADTGEVPRFPTAILVTGMMVLAGLSMLIGLVLDAVARGRRETKLLAYLGHASPGSDRSDSRMQVYK